jgi:hypothetical protein
VSGFKIGLVTRRRLGSVGTLQRHTLAEILSLVIDVRWSRCFIRAMVDARALGDRDQMATLAPGRACAVRCWELLLSATRCEPYNPSSVEEARPVMRASEALGPVGLYRTIVDSASR